MFLSVNRLPMLRGVFSQLLLAITAASVVSTHGSFLKTRASPSIRDLNAEVNTSKAFRKVLAEHPGRVSIVMFYGSTCPKCHDLQPTFQTLAEEYGSKADFFKWNVEVGDVSWKEKVKQIPTWAFYTNGTKITEVGNVGDSDPAEKGPLINVTERVLMQYAPAQQAQEEVKELVDRSHESKDAESVAQSLNYRRDGPCAERRNGTITSLLQDSTRPVEHLLILGAGPAGLSAAIYASRSALCPLIIAPNFQGQLDTKAAMLENYPAVTKMNGPQMLESMIGQGLVFGNAILNDAATSVDVSSGKEFVVKTKDNGEFRAHAIIIATGSHNRKLEVPGEAEFYGKGVSTCATCDGYAHKDKPCIVIGGGDSAAEDALVLSRLCSSVTVIHRRDKLRAGAALQKQVLKSPRISMMWNSEVQSFQGDASGNKLTHAVVLDNKSNRTHNVVADGAFVAIGHVPNTEMFKGVLDLDKTSEHIKVTHPSSRTSVPGVFAAGEVVDPIYRQAITSAGAGAIAAMDADSYLHEHFTDLDDDATATAGNNASMLETHSLLRRERPREQRLS